MFPQAAGRAERVRHLLFVSTPALWSAWPFLPLVRRADGAEELGVLFDARGACGLCGYSATVFLALCGAPHKASYADWLIRQTLLNVLLRSAGFFSHFSGLVALRTRHNKQCSRRPATCGRAG